MAAFKNNFVTYAVALSLMGAALYVLIPLLMKDDVGLEMIQFSCRENPGTPDSYVTGTLKNRTDDDINLNIEIEFYLTEKEMKSVHARIETGSLIKAGEFVRFDAIGENLASRTLDCGIRFSDEHGSPILVQDKTIRNRRYTRFN